MILTMGPEWIGCHYRTLIIWYPPDQYCSDYNLKDHEVTQAFAVLKRNNGFRNYKEEVYLAYSLTQWHMNYTLAQGRATR